MLLGCIGDDFTGSSDVGNTLVKGGMRVVQYYGIPGGPAALGVEAGVVAPKTRSMPPDQAVAQLLAALDWLRARGCRQILLKYCSTFDPTPRGNIGPVAQALADALGADAVIFCPAFPAAGRTIYQGHLFVADRLLSESGMEAHPLTPMTDPDLRRWLGLQTGRGVGYLPAATVWQGVDAIRDRLRAEAAAGRPFVIADAIRDADLVALGAGCRGYGADHRRLGDCAGAAGEFCAPRVAGRDGDGLAWPVGARGGVVGILFARHAGQVAAHVARGVADWVLALTGLPLVYSSADPQAVAAVQARHGGGVVAARLEGFLPNWPGCWSRVASPA